MAPSGVCKRIGRSCYGVELSPEYCWEQLVDSKAKLVSRAAGTGRGCDHSGPIFPRSRSTRASGRRSPIRQVHRADRELARSAAGPERQSTQERPLVRSAPDSRHRKQVNLVQLEATAYLMFPRLKYSLVHMLLGSLHRALDPERNLRVNVPWTPKIPTFSRSMRPEAIGDRGRRTQTAGLLVRQSRD